MHAFIVELPNQPGSLATLCEAIAERGINITGVSGATAGNIGAVSLLTNDEAGTRAILDQRGWAYRQIGLASASLEDRPGTLAAAARRLADAGVNIEALFPTGMTGGKVTIAFGVDNLEAAKQALGELVATPA